jgi:hypothetical protein
MYPLLDIEKTETTPFPFRLLRFELELLALAFLANLIVLLFPQVLEMSRYSPNKPL